MELFDKVSVKKCDKYDVSEILSELRNAAKDIGLEKEEIFGKKVMIKPNLLLAFPPEKAATTHPSVIAAAALLLKELGAKEIIIAESPGGIYSEKNLDKIYGVTGMKKASEESGAPLNRNLAWREFPTPDGVVSKTVNVIEPVFEADVIVNVCKMKTHALAVMTGAAKNLFGVIPGIMKFEMHARFKKPDDFFSMVIDLNAELDKKIKMLHICDAIVGMEGDGPSGGNPKDVGLLLMSRNPFNLDTVSSRIMGLEGKVKLLRLAEERGYCPSSSNDIDIICESREILDGHGFVPPDTAKGKKFDLIPPFLQPRPVIDPKICRGCGMCVESCPQKTIIMKNGKAKIDHDKCIRCYCCQELCVFKAVKVKKSFIYRLVEK